MRRRTGDWLSAEEIDEKFGDASRLFVLEPVRSAGEGVELGGRAEAKTVVRHFGEEEGVAFAPEDARGDVDGGVGEFCAMARGGAIPVDHGSERAGLRPGGAILREIFGRKRAGTAGAKERADAETKMKRAESGFGEKRELEEKHIPTAEKLAAICF